MSNFFNDQKLKLNERLVTLKDSIIQEISSKLEGFWKEVRDIQDTYKKLEEEENKNKTE